MEYSSFPGFRGFLLSDSRGFSLCLRDQVFLIGLTQEAKPFRGVSRRAGCFLVRDVRVKFVVVGGRFGLGWGRLRWRCLGGCGS